VVFWCSDWIVSDLIQLTSVQWHFWTSVISGFRSEVEENCALRVYNAKISGNSLPTFRDKLSVSSSRMNFSSPLKTRPIGCPETSVRDYHYSLCNSSEERSSHPWTTFSSYFFYYWKFCENLWHQQAAPLPPIIL